MAPTKPGSAFSISSLEGRSPQVAVTGSSERPDVRVEIDHLAVESPAGGDLSAAPLRLSPRELRAVPDSRQVRVFGRFEIQVSFEASFGSPCDPRRTSISRQEMRVMRPTPSALEVASLAAIRTA